MNVWVTLYRFFAGISVLGITVFLLRRPGFEGDTQTLIDNVFAFIRCAHHGALGGCPEAGPFPLLQFFPSLVLALMGWQPSSIIHLLSYASVAAFIASLAIVHRSLRFHPGVALLGVFILMTGYNLRYINSSFGEMVASFLILSFVAAILTKKNIWGVCALLFLSGCTKETSLPFLGALAAACFWLEPPERRAWKPWIHLGLTSILVILVTAGFNYLRFGTVFNPYYLSTATVVPSARLQVSFFFGLWLSPSGGILFFWPSFFGLLLISIWRMGKGRPGAGTSFLVSIILILLTLGFSRWYAPFGWHAWGPRLMLPWLPAIILILLHAHSTCLTRWVKSFRGFKRALALFLGIATFPQILVMLQHSLVSYVLEVPGCPPGLSVSENRDSYYRTIECLVWPPRWKILDFYFSATSFSRIFLAGFFTVLLMGLFGKAWRVMSGARQSVNTF